MSHESAEYFQREMERSGGLERSVLFLNLASDSSAQRLLTPRYALTVAEYLAFTEGKHVLVIMTDMTNYCEALREVSASRGEVPSRKGYPGYMYSDLATLFERAGRIRGLPGTLTQLPILTIAQRRHRSSDPGPVRLHHRGADRARSGSAPARHLPAGEGPAQPIAAHERRHGQGHDTPGSSRHWRPSCMPRTHGPGRARILASVVGEEGLTEVDRKFLEFGSHFESRIVGHAETRTLEESMAAGWEGLKRLPLGDLHRLSDAQIEQHLAAKAKSGD